MTTDHYSVEYFRNLVRDEHEQAVRLAEALYGLYAPTSVVDLGCASGLYLVPFLNYRPMKIGGIDASPEARHPSVCPIPSYITIADLRRPLAVPSADLALCLETAEHVEEQYADTLIDNVTSAAPIVVFSAAREGQPGDYHHNLQPREYWIEKFSKRGFLYDLPDTTDVLEELKRGHTTNWIDNLSIYKKQ